jgi:hypothetical protein
LKFLRLSFLDLFSPIGYHVSGFPHCLDNTMRSKRFTFPYILLLTILSGCGTALPILTEPLRQTITEKGLQEIRYYLSSEVTFRTIREVDTSSEAGPFRKDLHRSLGVSTDVAGKFVSSGDGWITVDFGQGIRLTFNRGASDGVYAMRGWGTVTIEGERYDIRIGMLSGGEVQLRYDAGRPQ